MKYLLILNDHFIKTNEDGTPYATLTFGNNMSTHLVVTPIDDKKPYLVCEHGGAYLEPRYMDAMLAFETRLKMAETLDRMFTNIDGTHKYDVDNMTVRELEEAFPDIDVPRFDGDKNIILMWRDKENGKVVPDVRDGWRYEDNIQETPVWIHTHVHCPKCNAINEYPEFNKTCNYCGANLKEASDG